MRRIAWCALVVCACVSATTWNRVHADGREQDGEWLFPGEHERHEAMWMLWPTSENKAGVSSNDVDLVISGVRELLQVYPEG